MKMLHLISILILIICTSAYSQPNTQPLKIAKVIGSPEHVLGGKLLLEIYKKAGIPINLTSIPSARALVESGNGVLDGELQRGPEIEETYPTLVRVPTPFNCFELSVFTIKNEIPVSDWASLDGFSIGFIKEETAAETGLKEIKNVNPTADREQLFNMLHTESLDIVITRQFNSRFYLKKKKLNTVRLLQPSVEKHPLYHYLHEKHKHYIPVIDQTIISMTESGELASMREKFAEEILEGIR